MEEKGQRERNGIYEKVLLYIYIVIFLYP